jgi:putative flippase GtrA
VTVDGRRTFVRFVVANALNTVLYWGLYLVLLPVLPYLVANGVALALAVLAAYLVTTYYAFGVAASRRSLLRFLAANGTTVVFRTAVVWALVSVASMNPALAPPVAVAVSTPLAYVLTRRAMAPRPVATYSLATV